MIEEIGAYIVLPALSQARIQHMWRFAGQLSLSTASMRSVSLAQDWAKPGEGEKRKPQTIRLMHLTGLVLATAG